MSYDVNGETSMLVLFQDLPAMVLRFKKIPWSTVDREIIDVDVSIVRSSDEVLVNH